MQGVERAGMKPEAEPEVHVKSKEFGAFSLPVEAGSGARGSGGLTASEEVRATMTATRRKWNIPDTVFESLPSCMEELATGGSRQATAAAKILLDMNQQNAADESTDSPAASVVIYIPDNGRGQ